MAHSWPKAWRATGFCFCPVQQQRVRMQEARLAKEKMHGRLACGRPLVVRLASEKHSAESAESSPKGITGEANKTGAAGGSLGQMSRSARIAAIKNKLKALEEEGSSAKKQKHADNKTCGNSVDSPGLQSAKR